MKYTFKKWLEENGGGDGGGGNGGDIGGDMGDAGDDISIENGDDDDHHHHHYGLGWPWYGHHRCKHGERKDGKCRKRPKT
jgi:hypothetical protein